LGFETLNTPKSPELTGFAWYFLLRFCGEGEKTFDMKNKLCLLPFAFFALVIFPMISAHSQTVITFDDLSVTSTGLAIASIPNGYQGLTWSNMDIVNAIREATANGTNGGYYGMVTPPNVAFNAFGNPGEIDSPGTNFNFLSAYLTGVWNSNLNIEVQGFGSGGLLYDTTVVASATSPTLFTFNYLDIDRLYFDSYGGQVAFGPTPEYQFVMDDFNFEFIPEPSSLLLTTGGVLALAAFVRRKRA